MGTEAPCTVSDRLKELSTWQQVLRIIVSCLEKPREKGSREETEKPASVCRFVDLMKVAPSSMTGGERDPVFMDGGEALPPRQCGNSVPPFLCHPGLY